MSGLSSQYFSIFTILEDFSCTLNALPTPLPVSMSSVAPTLKGLIITTELYFDLFANSFKNLNGNSLNYMLERRFSSFDLMTTVSLHSNNFKTKKYMNTSFMGIITVNI